VISVELARRLRDAGLQWVPSQGDRFHIPDRGMDHHVFSISEMTVDVDDSPGGRQIRFNGAVEWSLDSIREDEVVWLPSEAQLRDRLGSTFRSLVSEGDEFAVTISDGDEVADYRAETPSNAYGEALLDLLGDPGRHLSALLGDL
jgi:hypothetical protein